MNTKPETTQYMYDGAPVMMQHAGNFHGLIREDRPKIPENRVALMHWEGAKIPEHLWHATKSFLLYSDKKYNSEATVWFFYSDERNLWRAAVPPQYIGEGLSSHVITNDSGFDDAFSWVTPEQGWCENGTGHHHCGVSAFMSGTDEADEKKKTGIHYTLGNMSTKDKFSFHARASLRGLIYGIEGAQWFEGFDEDEFLKPGSHLDFPGKWLDHVKTRPATPRTTVTHHGSYYGHHNYGFGHGYSHQGNAVANNSYKPPVVATSPPRTLSTEETRKSKSRSSVNAVIRLLEKNDFLHSSLSDDTDRYKLTDILETFVDAANDILVYHTGRPTFQASDITNIVRSLFEMPRPEAALRNMTRDLDPVYAEAPPKTVTIQGEFNQDMLEWDEEWYESYDSTPDNPPVHMGYGVYLTDEDDYVDINGDEIPEEDPRLENLIMCPSKETDSDVDEEYELVLDGIWRKKDNGQLVDVHRQPISELARNRYLFDLQDEAMRGSGL